MAVRYEDEMIILDAGMGFPEESAYGVDVCIPNFDFLEEYRENITAIVLTHGHEDHLGALPYVLKKFNVPVYCSHFTAGLAESKLQEHNLLGDTLMHRVEPRDVVDIGVFSVEFIRVSHSLVDCFSLAIKTPVGTIIHTGDYKVDETPVIPRTPRCRAARHPNAPSSQHLRKFLPRRAGELLWLRLRLQFTDSKSSSILRNSLIAKSACSAARC